MAVMTRELTGAELANALAAQLTDLEFELLVRARIKQHLKMSHNKNSNLSESHDSVTFYFDGRDASKWTVNLGETYSKRKDSSGEVLSVTFDDVEKQLGMLERNKMSLLLSCTTIDAGDGTLKVSASQSMASNNDEEIPF